MKFTLNWLKEHVDCDLSPAALADILTMLGLEVDAVEELYAGFDLLRVAEIVSVAPHPNADKLVLCDVRVGDETKKIVCGAPNARAGLKTAIALPGLTMPGGFTIKKSKIRGEVSEGMLCSERELGLSDAHDGIMELPAEMESGRPITEALGLADTMIEVDLTPNRPDCTSVRGIAREVAGAVATTLKPLPAADLPPLDGAKSFSVTIEAPENCPRYAARRIDNIKVGPSPWWLRRALLAVGQRPINNVVDATNFVMLELGQPLHAFDLDRLDGGRIVVRGATAGETITTLDGTRRELEAGMLLICGGETPAAVAGVMGGADSEVTGATTTVLLESAYFHPVSVRRTARRLKLGTDASYRFERGVDPHGTITALDRAAALIAEISGGTVSPEGVDVVAGALPENPAITLRPSRVNALLGTDLDSGQVADYLRAIEIPATVVDEDQIEVRPPSFRVDLEREVDLVEEIARLTGYNEIATTMPVVPMSFSEESPHRTLRRRLTALFTAAGFSEAINYSFIGETDYDHLGLAPDDPARNSVAILNPLTAEQAVMRTTLLPGLLQNLRHNINHQNTDIALFELGKTFHPRAGEEQPDEPYHLCAVMSGRRTPGAPVIHFGQDRVDLLDAKGLVAAMAQDLRLDLACRPAATAPPWAEAGRVLEIMIADETTGVAAVVNSDVLRRFGIKQEVIALDIDIERLLAHPATPPRFTPLPRYPAVTWDLAFIVDAAVGAGDMARAIEESGLKYVRRVEIFDVYSGKPIAKGQKSVALSITYQAENKTLNDKAVNKIHNKVIALIGDRFGGRLREE